MTDSIPDDFPDPDGWTVTYSETYDAPKFRARHDHLIVVVNPVSTSSGRVYNCQAFVSDGPYAPKNKPRGSMIAESTAAITPTINQLKESLK